MNKLAATKSKNASTTDQCARTLLEALPLVMDFVRAEMRRSRTASFSIPQFRSLIFLKRRSGASLSDLARHLGVTMATASTMIDRLVRQGLVQRVTVPEERRRVSLSLSGAGSALVEQAQIATRKRLARALSVLPVRELETVNHGLSLLKNTLGEARNDDQPDMAKSSK